MRIFFVLYFLVTGFFSIHAQRQVFLELGGSGGLASLNYEQTWRQGEKVDLAYQAGFSFAPIDRNNGSVLIFPLLVKGILGKTAHRAELGIGQTLSITTRGSFFPTAIGTAGYRWQSLEKPWCIRLVYTPIVSYLLDFQWQHWGGLSIGYTF
jgi:hypothetical protein